VERDQQRKAQMDSSCISVPRTKFVSLKTALVRWQGTTEKSVQSSVTQIVTTRPKSNAQKARIIMVVRNNRSASQREGATIMLSVRDIATKSARQIQTHANNPPTMTVALPKMRVSLNKSIIMAIIAMNNTAN
jgi:hypothetical protein